MTYGPRCEPGLSAKGHKKWSGEFYIRKIHPITFWRKTHPSSFFHMYFLSVLIVSATSHV